MPTHNESRLTHHHIFNAGNPAAERGTRIVMWITAAMMVVEIIAGWWFNSMALLADGWHMSSHAVAIGLSAFAYAAARRYATDPRFAFGTWKIEILAGFASAIFLLGVAAMMVFGSLERLFSPQPIHYQDAIIVAIIGLLVNIVCAMILGKAHDHHHGHGHGSHSHHDHARADSAQKYRQVHQAPQYVRHSHERVAHPRHHDLNLQSAYVHVIADAATSVLAILALVGGLYYGWSWLDPVMGLVGAVLVAVWAKGLLMETGKVLLDREMDHPVVDEIREVIELLDQPDETTITDLHVWRVGKEAYACAVSILTRSSTLTPARVRDQLGQHKEIVHTTIEIHRYE
jgi:cation diffusion facilitator family transporter